MYRGSETLGRRSILTKSRSQDVADLLFHRAAILRRPNTQSPLQVIIKISYRDTCQDLTSSAHLRIVPRFRCHPQPSHHHIFPDALYTRPAQPYRIRHPR